MSDTLGSFSRGTQPFDERDLDALLTGDATDLPEALHPVADVIAALRSAPSPGELRGEEAVRAEFRMRAAFGHAPAGEPAAGTAARPAGVRGRRSGKTPGRRVLTRLALIPAAAVIVVAVAYSGNLPGPIQRLAHITIAAPSARPGSGGTSHGRHASSGGHPSLGGNRGSGHASVSGSAVAAPSSRVTAPPAAAASLCNEWSADYQRDPGGVSWRNSSVFQRLSTAAGGAGQVYGYCSQVWQQQPGHHIPRPPRYPVEMPSASGGQDSGGGSGNSGGGGNQGQGNKTPTPTPTPTPTASATPDSTPSAGSTGSQDGT